MQWPRLCATRVPLPTRLHNIALCVKATLTTVQGAYILQSLDLKIARRENVAAFAQGMCTFSLHCMVAGSRRPCNASRSFYEMKPSSVDFQKGTV
jgi:hypothetical protein